MTDAPTWYDVLDVPRDASSEEVRAAWKDRIADLEPGDRRFDTLNRAAKVLLDPPARSTYDDALAPVEDRSPVAPRSLVEEGGLTPVTGPRSARPGLVRRLRRSSTSGSDGLPSWLLGGLGVLAAGLVVATAWTWTRGETSGGDPSTASTLP